MNQIPRASSSGSPFQGYPTLDLEGLFRVFIRRIPLIAAIFGVCVGLAIVYALLAPKMYLSTAVVYVEPQRDLVLSEDMRQVRSQNFQNLDALKSLEKSIVSGAVILRAVDRNDLRDDPEFLKPNKNGEPWSDTDIVEKISRQVKATLQRGTRLIQIDVTDESPERARLLARAFVNEFEALSIEKSFEASRRAREILSRKAHEQLERVNDAENALQKFREKYSDLQLDEGGIVETKLADLDRLLSTAKNERLRLLSQVEQLETIGTDEPERILEVGDYVKIEHIAKLLLARSTKRAEFVKIQGQYESIHPVYRDHLAELNGLDQQVRITALDLGQSIRKRYVSALEHEQKLKKSVDEQKKELLATDHIRKEFRSLNHAVEAASKTYQSLLSRINETDATEGVNESHIRLMEDPMLPMKPARPKKTLIVGLAGFLGLGLGAGIVLLLYLLDRSLRTRNQVEQALGISMLGEIPLAEAAGEGAPSESLIVATEPHSLVAESFRGLRMSLAALSPRSVMFTSAMPGEGKSYCAANLGLLQAQYGYRTLLVDADFRRPSLAGMLLPRNGNKSALQSQNVCQQTTFPNLFLLPCAQYAPGTGDMMNGEHFAAMLWEAYRTFDCVIIDSSPIGVVSDALNFARYADAVALVVRSGVTQMGDAQRVCQEIRKVRAPLAGCILNASNSTTAEKEAYYQTYAPAPERRPVLSLQMSQT